MKLESIALHHGYESKNNDQKSATTPIYQTSGFNMAQTYLISRLKEIFIQG